jgi:hypothetical protein
LSSLLSDIRISRMLPESVRYIASSVRPVHQSTVERGRARGKCSSLS